MAVMPAVQITDLHSVSEWEARTAPCTGCSTASADRVDTRPDRRMEVIRLDLEDGRDLQRATQTITIKAERHEDREIPPAPGTSRTSNTPRSAWRFAHLAMRVPRRCWGLCGCGLRVHT